MRFGSRFLQILLQKAKLPAYAFFLAKKLDMMITKEKMYVVV